MGSKKTFTYKVVKDCAIKADIYRDVSHTTQPVILFVHSGALIGGSRCGLPIVIELLANAGYTVVSIDYRLAPETKLNGIIEDLQDAVTWVREEGPALFNIDPNRIGVMGDSAGGYLALISGVALATPPKVLVSIYGYGDITAPCFNNPDPFYCQQPLVEEAMARESVGTHTLSETLQPNNRRFFYLYCRQHGVWPKEITGYDPANEPEAYEPFCPIRHITAQYPPTILLHGDKDTDVPYEQSVAMAKKLAEHGVDYQLITLLGKGHNFDINLDDPDVAKAINSVFAFLKQYL
jgi:acetyl esterase/lipase